MRQEFLFIGMGGQGVVASGRLLARAAFIEGKQVLEYENYAAFMRGDRSESIVIIDREKVVSPPLLLSFSGIVVMHEEGVRLRPETGNLRYLVHFDAGLRARLEAARRPIETAVKPGGLLLINTSIIRYKPQVGDITVIGIPVAALAEEIGSIMIANMVALGALVEHTKVVSQASLIAGLREILPEHRRQLIPLNERALARGAAFVKEHVKAAG